jgi:hypothetical protein
MDPYLEDPGHWPAFHQRLVATLYQVILPNLADRYVVARTTLDEPIEIRRRGDGSLVTLVEVVSPAHKTTDAGREAYLGRRRKALEDKASVVEIDLVMQGRPTLDYSRDGLPEWDYAVTVARSTHPERYEIYTATLQKRLPRFRLPLAPDDRDAVLDLQSAFTRCYAEGGYFSRIDYRRDPSVPLGEEDCRWLDAALVSRGLRAPAPPHDDIATAAYFIWQQEGCPHGRDREHWQMALTQLRAKNAAEGTR